MSKQQFTLSKIDVAVLGNRLLNVYRSEGKAELSMDNQIFKELIPHIDEVTVNETARNKEYIALANREECNINGELVIYTGKDRTEAEKIVLGVEKELKGIREKFNKQNEIKVNITVEVTIFLYLRRVVESAIDTLCSNDKKIAEHNLTAEKQKLIQLNRETTLSIGRINEALDEAKKVS